MERSKEELLAEIEKLKGLLESQALHLECGWEKRGKLALTHANALAEALETAANWNQADKQTAIALDAPKDKSHFLAREQTLDKALAAYRDYIGGKK